MIMNDRLLRVWAKLNVSPFTDAQINPASIDLRLGPEIRLPGFNGERWSIPLEFNSFELNKGLLILASSAETIKMPPNYAGSLSLKSTMGRLGLEHLHAGWIEPGFEGQITFELINHSSKPIILDPLLKVCQLTLLKLEEPPEVPYSEKGHYQNQKGVTGPWTEGEGLK